MSETVYVINEGVRFVLKEGEDEQTNYFLEPNYEAGYLSFEDAFGRIVPVAMPIIPWLIDSLRPIHEKYLVERKKQDEERAEKKKKIKAKQEQEALDNELKLLNYDNLMIMLENLQRENKELKEQAKAKTKKKVRKKK